MPGRNVDLIMGMKINDFLDANKRAYIEYTKTKGQIERNPIQVKGSTDFSQMSNQISRVGNAFQSLGTDAKPVFEMIASGNLNVNNLSKGFMGLSDMGLRVYQMVGTLKGGISGLMASIGPLGWVMLGITALTTAFSLFSPDVDNASKSIVNFKKALDELQETSLQLFGRLEGVKIMASLYKAVEYDMVQAAKNNDIRLYESKKKYLEAIKKELDREVEFERLKNGGLIDDKIKKADEEIRIANKTKDAEIKKIDALRQYEFESGRIGYLEYIGYLRSKLNGLEQNTTEQKFEYQKLYDEINQIEQDFINRSANNQDRLTADFSANINKRLNEVQKYVTKSVNTTTTETKKEARVLSPIMDNLAGIIGYSIVDQLQRGSSAAKNMGASLVKMVESFAATLATKTIIWAFFNLVTQGGAGSLLGFLGFEKGGEIKGKAEGGNISRADIARSAFTPSGEDGLIGVQIGETIINRKATQMFQPILDKMNDLGRRGYGYATGGQVSEGGILKMGGIQDFNSLVEAIKNIQTTIKLELDSVEFYRNTFPKYEKIRDRNRVY